MDVDSKPTVHAVDNDPTTTNFIRDVAERMNVLCKTHASGLEFLEAIDQDTPGCAVVAIRIADIGGPQIQRRLCARSIDIPIVFISAHASVSMIVRVMREGALSVLEKPIVEQELWDIIQEALRVDRCRREERSRMELMRTRFGAVTPKELAVLDLILNGKASREIAQALGVSVRTVELRRGSLMEKLQARSFVELVRIGMTMGNGSAGHANCRLCPIPVCPKQTGASHDAPARILDRHDRELDFLGLD